MFSIVNLHIRKCYINIRVMSRSLKYFLLVPFWGFFCCNAIAETVTDLTIKPNNYDSKVALKFTSVDTLTMKTYPSKNEKTLFIVEDDLTVNGTVSAQNVTASKNVTAERSVSAKYVNAESAYFDDLTLQPVHGHDGPMFKLHYKNLDTLLLQSYYTANNKNIPLCVDGSMHVTERLNTNSLLCKDVMTSYGTMEIKNNASDQTMVLMTNNGKMSAVSLSLHSEEVSKPYNPSLEINFTDDKTWNLGSYEKNTKKSTPSGLTITSDTLKVSNEMVVGGTITCKEKLKVVEVNTDRLRAKDVTVDMGDAAGYVFDENYNLKSLGEVESYVKENKHLPGIPSASQMKEDGMNVSEMSNLLLEKIEELTLHMIRLEKENQALKAEMKAMKDR